MRGEIAFGDGPRVLRWPSAPAAKTGLVRRPGDSSPAHDPGPRDAHLPPEAPRQHHHRPARVPKPWPRAARRNAKPS